MLKFANFCARVFHRLLHKTRVSTHLFVTILLLLHHLHILKGDASARQARDLYADWGTDILKN